MQHPITSYARSLTVAFCFFLVLIFSTCKKESPAPQPEPQAPAGPVLPTISTLPVINIGYYTAKSGGNVSSEGNSVIMSVGLCWDTLPNPTTLRYNRAVGAGTGTFSVRMDSLKPATKYFVRAFAKNLGGTAYGNQVEFTTPVVPPAPDLFTDRNFKIVAASVTPMFNGSIDLYNDWDACSKDDIYRFEKSGVLKLDEGPLKCSSSSPQILTGTWAMISGNKQLVMVLNGNTQIYDIVKNDGNELVVSYSFSSGSINYTVTYTFKVF